MRLGVVRAEMVCAQDQYSWTQMDDGDTGNANSNRGE